MRIAVLSGKGGTGKTLLSVNLAAVANDAIYVDCDVEEPNGALFFKPENLKTEDITVKIPVFDSSQCTGCKECVDFCKFNALAWIKDSILVFEDVCHSCGGCVLVCPESAITERGRIIGQVHHGTSQNVTILTGELNPGEESGVPIIKHLLRELPTENHVFIDCPPGSACTVMESIKDADYCVLVTEPTIFGLHNLRMVQELVRKFAKPYGVVINKSRGAKNPATEFCKSQNITLLGEIPYDPDLGLTNSNALIAAQDNQVYYNLFASLLDVLNREVMP